MAVSYEDVTPESIKNEILGGLAGSMEVREGSYANLLVSPAAFQIYKIYQLLPVIEAMAFPDETSGEFIDRRAADFGLVRTRGSRAEVLLEIRATGAVSMPAGTAVFTEDGLCFFTTEALSAPGGSTAQGLSASRTYRVPAEAEEIGRRYNVEPHTIVRMKVNLHNISAVTNPEAAYGGTDDETDRAFLDRFHEFLRRPISSGNVNHYISWAREVPGVSFAAAVPLWNGPGTVKVIIAGPDHEPVDQTIVAACAAHIEAERPIGASVTVQSVEARTIDVSAAISLTAGAAVQEVQAELEAALVRLLAALPFGESKILRYSRVLGLLLACGGVEEYQSFTLCGGTANVALTNAQTPVAGTVSITEVAG